MGKVVHNIISLTTPLTFGPYKGLALVDIIEDDKLYFKTLLQNDKKYKISAKVGKKMKKLLDSYNVAALGKYQKLKTVTVYDKTDNRLGYFILDQDIREHSREVNMENLRLDITVINDRRAEALILNNNG